LPPLESKNYFSVFVPEHNKQFLQIIAITNRVIREEERETFLFGGKGKKVLKHCAVSLFITIII
jgi:hypothetical protein